MHILRGTSIDLYPIFRLMFNENQNESQQRDLEFASRREQRQNEPAFSFV